MAPLKRKIWTLKDVGNSHEGGRDVDEGGDSHDEAMVGRDFGGKFAKQPLSRAQQQPWNSPYCQDASDSATTRKSSNKGVTVCHISSLPNSASCQATLERVRKEFQPIWERRGYNIKSVSEMCCCCDGLDEMPGRRTKLRIQPSNVLGYNMTRYGRAKSHTIHLRLRQAHDHTQLIPWEDVAGTMAHEMSHCVHSPHNGPFYKLMEQILEDHAVQTANSLMPSFAKPLNAATVSRTLGPSDGTSRLDGAGFGGDGETGAGTKLGGNRNGRSRLLDVGRSLGGARGDKPMSAAERRQVVAKAAEARRRQMDQVRRIMERSKQPCVIEIPDGDEDDNDDVVNDYSDRGNRSKEPPAMTIGNANDSIVIIDQQQPQQKTKRMKRGGRPIQKTATNKIPAKAPHRSPVGTPVQNQCAIDLTQSPCHPLANSRASYPEWESIARDDKDSAKQDDPCRWSCDKCTFINRTMSLVCDICHSQRRL